MPDSRAITEAAVHAATSTTTFYELLDLPPEYHPSQDTPLPPPIPAGLLRKTYRKTSLLYHPDKNPSPDAAAHFHTLTTAYDVLSDVATKQAYDQALAARLARKRKSDIMGSERRRLKEELEARERVAAGGGSRGWKKQRTTSGDEEAEFERQLDRLKEEGAQLRMKREEALRQGDGEAKEEEDNDEQKSAQEGRGEGGGGESAAAESMFSEIDKTVFIKLRTDPNTPTTSATLTRALAGFGEILSCLVRESAGIDSKKNNNKKKKKEALTTGVLVFKSILSAYDVVDAFRNGHLLAEGGKGGEALWGRIREVKFAGGKEPDVSRLLAQRGVAASEQLQARTDDPLPGGKPKFSFPPVNITTATNITTGALKVGLGLSSADYESVTLLRMREMERKILEAEIRAEGGAESEGKGRD